MGAREGVGGVRLGHRRPCLGQESRGTRRGGVLPSRVRRLCRKASARVNPVATARRAVGRDLAKRRMGPTARRAVASRSLSYLLMRPAFRGRQRCLLGRNPVRPEPTAPSPMTLLLTSIIRSGASLHLFQDAPPPRRMPHRPPRRVELFAARRRGRSSGGGRCSSATTGMAVSGRKSNSPILPIDGLALADDLVVDPATQIVAARRCSCRTRGCPAAAEAHDLGQRTRVIRLVARRTMTGTCNLRMRRTSADTADGVAGSLVGVGDDGHGD